MFWAFSTKHADKNSLFCDKKCNRSFSPLKSNGNMRIKALLLCPLPGGEEVQLIMEYLPQGNLKDYLPNRKVGMSQCLMFAQQICQVSFMVYTNHLHFPLGSAQFKCRIVIVLALCCSMDSLSNCLLGNNHSTTIY